MEVRDKAKLGLVAFVLAAGLPEAATRLGALTEGGIEPVPLAGFAALLALSMMALVGAAFLRLPWLRWVLAIMFAAAGALVGSYQRSVGDFMSYDGFVTMMASTGDMGAALAQHGGNTAFSAFVSALLLIGIGLRPGQKPDCYGLSRFITIPGVLAIAVMLFLRGGAGANGLPPPVTGTAYGMVYGYEAFASAASPREDVVFTPKGREQRSDVVLIVDESIAGAYLDINGHAGVRSGLIDAETDASIDNFGLAAAITNCSAGANAALRFGGTRDTYLDRLRRGPSIWAFAKKAGLDTVYLDAQRTGGAFQNLMDAEERALIDRWEQYGEVSVLHRDHHAADRLAELLNDDRAQFILVNKIGGHFPVSDKFPDSHAQYRPMLPRKSLYVSEAEADDMDGSQASWRLYRNSYRNTLTWNVGGFFDRLFAQAQIGDATIIYTADHGQSFHERGEYSEATHCTPNPQIEEGVVPLVVIGEESDALPFGDAANAVHDATSTYRIFPTLLRLMGYRLGDIEPNYGPDLLSSAADPMTFNTNFNARLRSNPRWQHIDVSQVQSPPVSDY